MTPHRHRHRRPEADTGYAQEQRLYARMARRVERARRAAARRRWVARLARRLGLT
jgi:hypothetical protein